MLKLGLTLNLCKKSYIVKNITVRTMASAANDDVLFEEVNGKGIITLNRPKALNALNLSMVKKLIPKLVEWEKNQSMVLIKGAGGKSFCAGGDVVAIVQAGLRGEKLGEEFFKYEYSVDGLVGRYKIPYIALIDGITMGGGVGLSVHGRYRIATEKTLFAMPETRIGLFPDVGGSYFLPKLCGKLGLYLALTGHRLKGGDVYRAGIATHFVDSCKIQELENDIIINACNDKDIKKILEKYHLYEKEFSLEPHLKIIDECFSATTVEGIIESLKKNNSDFAKKTCETLCTMSPTSMKVSKALLEKTKGMSLAECLEIEYRVACNTLNKKEFYEGRFNVKY